MEKRRKHTVEETFDFFWDHYHQITGKAKTDKKASFKKWKKINLENQRKAYLGVREYFIYAINEYGINKSVKMARTYLEDEVWKNDYNVSNQQPEGRPQKYQRPKSSIVYDKHN